MKEVIGRRLVLPFWTLTLFSMIQVEMLGSWIYEFRVQVKGLRLRFKLGSYQHMYDIESHLPG